jgi:erythronate-4-phosphate dehydrogenase
MKFVVDENIPLAEAFFGEMGELVQLPGRDIRSDQLQDADVLLVRSVTQVNARLLEGSSVKFVGSATIGEDHLDTEFLSSQNIAYSSAPGCNAESVVNYVISALSVLSERHTTPWLDWTVGIIGLGNIGGRLADMLSKLGVKVIGYDPFKVDHPFHTEELNSLIQAADVISLHVPLTKEGPHPTYHLVDAPFLQAMQDNACLVNTSRGGVVDEQALLEQFSEYSEFEAVLDVWETEPEPNLQLMDAATLATPHIAGYSLDGKLRGTETLYQKVSECFGLPIRLKLGQLIPEPPLKRISFSTEADPLWAINTAIRACYDVRNDDFRMRQNLHTAQRRGEVFDRLRKEYPKRRDFEAVRVEVRKKMSALRDYMGSLGFDVRDK